MITVLLTSLFYGAVVFNETDLQDVHIGPVNPLSGLAGANFRHADIDGDGLMDLVFTNRICLQRDRSFPETGNIPLPENIMPAEMDLWDNRIFYRYPDRIVISEWGGAEWREIQNQEIDWAGEEGFSIESRGSDAGARVSFGRFIYDVDQDGSPELVAVSRTGIHLYYYRDNRWEGPMLTGKLPALSPEGATGQKLWPEQVRRITFPARQMTCRIIIDNDTIAIIDREKVAPDEILFHMRRWQPPAFSSISEARPDITEILAGPMPSWMEPCHLNEDDIQDFAGGHWIFSTASAFPVTLYETVATLDNGATFHRYRSPVLRHFQPACSFIDFDGDGDRDIVTESTGMFNGGIREIVARLMTLNELPHEIAVYEQVRKTFSEKPRLRRKIPIRLQAPPFREGAMLARYQAGELISIAGDYNGDNYRDLAVRDDADRLSIYLAAGYSFPEKADAVIHLPEEARFRIYDINADGRDDIVLFLAAESSVDSRAWSRVCFSEEGSS